MNFAYPNTSLRQFAETFKLIRLPAKDALWPGNPHETSLTFDSEVFDITRFLTPLLKTPTPSIIPTRLTLVSGIIF